MLTLKGTNPRTREFLPEPSLRRAPWFASAILAALLIAGLTGCQSPKSNPAAIKSAEAGKSDVILLHEGDTVKVAFPGAPNLNTVQQVRRDGRITLPIIGELRVIGMTPADLEKELVRQYGPQLQSKEITVSLESVAFPAYVTGCVLRPGKIQSDRPLTALEAVMEAGGFDYLKANLKKVRIIRTENGQTQHIELNLKGVLKGGDADNFKLKPSDIVYVPERFSLF